jgi:ABC-type polysaccharide/polyol phosphate export permease
MLAGRPVVTECKPTLADGLAVPLVGANAYATAAPLIDKVVIVRLVFIKENKENNFILYLAKNILLLLFYVWLKWKRLLLKVHFSLLFCLLKFIFFIFRSWCFRSGSCFTRFITRIKREKV